MFVQQPFVMLLSQAFFVECFGSAVSLLLPLWSAARARRNPSLRLDDPLGFRHDVVHWCVGLGSWPFSEEEEGEEYDDILAKPGFFGTRYPPP